MDALAGGVIIDAIQAFFVARMSVFRYALAMSAAVIPDPDRDMQIAALTAALATAKAELAARDLLIETLRVQIARMRRMAFGASSEKLSAEIAQLELALEELEAAATVTAIVSPAPKPERPVPVRALPDHLPRDEVVVEPVSGPCTCPDCGGALRRLSADAAEQLDVAPVAWRVVRTIRPKYSCRACDQIVQAPAPVKAIARGRATFATLAHVIVSKFDHHLPLYRQAEMMAAQGIDIDRSTLAGWTGQASALIDPIVSRIRDEGLKASKIHADDTPVPVLDPGRGRTATGRLWTYAVDNRASGSTAPPLVWHRFTPDRTGHTRKPSLPPSPAISRPMPMPDTTSSTRPGASPKSPAGRISGARYSTSTRPSRRR